MDLQNKLKSTLKFEHDVIVAETRNALSAYSHHANVEQGQAPKNRTKVE